MLQHNNRNVYKLKSKLACTCTYCTVHVYNFINFACLLSAVDNPLDYMGRSFLHVPQDVDVNLRADEPPDQCFVPKKLIHTWYMYVHRTLYTYRCDLHLQYASKKSLRSV